MTRQPEISGASKEGEAIGAPEATRRHQPCGTAAGARWHQRRGQEPCQPCREALRAYNREYARLARESAAWRARAAATKRRWDQQHREELNTGQRRRARIRRAQELRDARHATDHVVIDRLIAGEAVSHNRAERLEAVRQLRDRGVTYLDIATRLHIQHRQVHRDIAELGLVERRETVA